MTYDEPTALAMQAREAQRELAKLTNLSDPYVSQIGRGLHEPVELTRALAHPAVLAFGLRPVDRHRRVATPG